MQGFIRIKRRNGIGGESISFALVENVRISKYKIRQNYIAYLGTIWTVNNKSSRKSGLLMSFNILDALQKMKLKRFSPEHAELVSKLNKKLRDLGYHNIEVKTI